MRRTMMLILTLALGGAVTALPAQEPDPPTAASADARIAASLQTALEAGIPVELLESKIEEGRAKGVASVRIAAAVEARLAALLRASQAMDRAEVQGVTAGDLSIGADALEAGVSEAALATIQASAPRERRAVAVAVLAALVELGNAPDAALARVQAALGRGPAALADLRARTIVELRARGGGPPVDLDAAARLDGRVGIGNRPGGG
jgi:hypothetical protein